MYRRRARARLHMFSSVCLRLLSALPPSPFLLLSPLLNGTIKHPRTRTQSYIKSSVLIYCKRAYNACWHCLSNATQRGASTCASVKYHRVSVFASSSSSFFFCAPYPPTTTHLIYGNILPMCARPIYLSSRDAKRSAATATICLLSCSLRVSEIQYI